LDTEITSSSSVSLTVNPRRIDFGCLKPGSGANAILRVSGGPGQVIVHSDRLKVTPISFGPQSIELQLTLLDGSVGELIWDDVLLRGGSGELKVLVTARWEGVIEPKPKLEPEPLPVGEPMPPKPLSRQKEKETQTTKPEVSGNQTEGRTFTGKTCRWCGNNIRYDSNSQLWKPCKTCRGARIPISVLLRISREFYLGLKEVRSSMAEIWDTLQGKEKKRR